MTGGLRDRVLHHSEWIFWAARQHTRNPAPLTHIQRKLSTFAKTHVLSAKSLKPLALRGQDRHRLTWRRLCLPCQASAIDPTTPQILQSLFNKAMAHAMRAAITLHNIHTKGVPSKVPLERMQVCTQLVDAAFDDTLRLHRGNAGASKLMRHIQATTLKAKCHMTWQEIKGKGDDQIRSLAAHDFNDLVPVMVQMGIGELGLRKRSITYMGTQELTA